MQNDTQKPLDSDVITYAFAVPLGFLGLLTYGLSLYLIHKSPRYHNVFGILCTTCALFHIQTVSALLLWTLVRITVQMGLTSFPWLIFSRITAPFANSTIFAIVWMQFVLAINRLSAISYPIAYKHIFSTRNAWITVVSLWLIIECTRYVEADIYSWSTLFGPCDHYFIAYIASSLSDGIIIAAVIVDAVAFYRIVTYLKGANRTQQRLGHEILFFKETCVSTAIQVFSTIIFRIDMPVSRLTKVTYTWLMMHTLDGLSFIFFNRHLLKKQNIVGVRTNTVDLRTKTIRNDLNTAMICTTANTPVNIAVTKRSVNVIGNNIN
ncbi:hypothetical protein DINM_000699 [Dirofilaria immitis]|nr:hypothetical protein [Dirofilaria immitis]